MVALAVDLVRAVRVVVAPVVSEVPDVAALLVPSAQQYLLIAPQELNQNLLLLRSVLALPQSGW